MDAMANETVLPIQLRFSDIDSYGHVNNVTLLSLLETARVQLHNLESSLAAGDYDGGGAPAGIVTGVSGGESLRDLAGPDNYTLVARQEIEYLAPLLYRAEPVYVAVWVTEVGRSSFQLCYAVAEQDRSTVYALAATTMVLASRDSGRAVPLPDAYRESLEQYRGAEVPFRRRSPQSAGA
jgi:acyl-CoA thioester hydrolase